MQLNMPYFVITKPDVDEQCDNGSWISKERICLGAESDCWEDFAFQLMI